MLLHAITATLVYFQQADITRSAIADRAARTAFFAQLDIWVNVLTIVIQIFLTGRLLKWLGVGLTLAMLPAISLAGFLAIGLMPGLGLLALFQVLRRAMNYALSRPAREVLFTVLRREDKYKAKSFMDTFVYRAGDQIGAWSSPAPDVDRPRVDRDLVCGRAPRRRLVRAQPLAGAAPGRDGTRTANSRPAPTRTPRARPGPRSAGRRCSRSDPWRKSWS